MEVRRGLETFFGTFVKDLGEAELLVIYIMVIQGREI